MGGLGGRRGKPKMMQSIQRNLAKVVDAKKVDGTLLPVAAEA